MVHSAPTTGGQRRSGSSGRTRVGVDLDDVLADLIGELISLQYELSGVALTRDQVYDWDVFDQQVHQTAREHRYACLTPFPGAQAFLRWLNQRYHVHIITYRDASVREVTEDWLQRHLPGLYHQVHFAGGSKVEVCRRLGVQILIDDSVNQIPAVTAQLGIPGVLVDSPMNQHIPESALVRRAASYARVQQLVPLLLDCRNRVG